jgi:hypothetical protein
MNNPAQSRKTLGTNLGIRMQTNRMVPNKAQIPHPPSRLEQKLTRPPIVSHPHKKRKQNTTIATDSEQELANKLANHVSNEDIARAWAGIPLMGDALYDAKDNADATNTGADDADADADAVMNTVTDVPSKIMHSKDPAVLDPAAPLASAPLPPLSSAAPLPEGESKDFIKWKKLEPEKIWSHWEKKQAESVKSLFVIVHQHIHKNHPDSIGSKSRRLGWQIPIPQGIRRSQLQKFVEELKTQYPSYSGEVRTMPRSAASLSARENQPDFDPLFEQDRYYLTLYLDKSQ